MWMKLLGVHCWQSFASMWSCTWNFSANNCEDNAFTQCLGKPAWIKSLCFKFHNVSRYLICKDRLLKEVPMTYMLFLAIAHALTIITGTSWENSSVQMPKGGSAFHCCTHIIMQFEQCAPKCLTTLKTILTLIKYFHLC